MKMDILDLIKKRRSVRSYKSDSIPQKSLDKILEAARFAPSASNKQSWKLILVSDSEKKQELAKAANNQMFISEAPIIIVGVALNPEHLMPCDIHSYTIDLAIVLDHITLVASEQELGTCWIGAFSQQEVKKILDIPDNHKIVALMPIGFPADSPNPKKRKEMKEIIVWN